MSTRHLRLRCPNCGGSLLIEPGPEVACLSCWLRAALSYPMTAASLAAALEPALARERARQGGEGARQALAAEVALARFLAGRGGKDAA